MSSVVSVNVDVDVGGMWDRSRRSLKQVQISVTFLRSASMYQTWVLFNGAVRLLSLHFFVSFGWPIGRLRPPSTDHAELSRLTASLWLARRRYCRISGRLF